MKLTHGSGSETEGGCWMSAIQWYSYPQDAWHDEPKCVDPVIATLCIWLNDNTPLGEMESVIGPHLFAPLGTSIGGEMSRNRAYKCADWAVRKIVPMILRSLGNEGEAVRLESLPKVLDRQLALFAEKEAKSVESYAAKAAANAAGYAALNPHPYHASHRTCAVAAYAVEVCNPTKVRAMVLDLILELCEMGRTEPETTRTKEQTIACLVAGNFTEGH